MTNAITFPNTQETFKSALKKGIENYMKSPVKKEGKLNESMAVALGFENKDQMPKTEEQSLIKTPFVYIDDNEEVTISDEKIHPDVVSNPKNGYMITERDELIDSILDIISEHKRGSVNRGQMEDALSFLYSIKDEYVISNIWDSQYVAASLNPEQFNNLCDEIIGESKETKKTTNVVETSECWKCIDCGAEWSFVMGDEVPEICQYCKDD